MMHATNDNYSRREFYCCEFGIQEEIVLLYIFDKWNSLYEVLKLKPFVDSISTYFFAHVNWIPLNQMILLTLWYRSIRYAIYNICILYFFIIIIIIIEHNQNLMQMKSTINFIKLQNHHFVYFKSFSKFPKILKLFQIFKYSKLFINSELLQDFFLFHKKTQNFPIRFKNSFNSLSFFSKRTNILEKRRKILKYFHDPETRCSSHDFLTLFSLTNRN